MRWLLVGGGALLLLTLFTAAGFAANVSCSGNASGNWYIYNKNVTCQDAFALNMTGTTVYIYGASNVTFLNITNSSIYVNVYNNSNFTANNVTINVVNGYDSSAMYFLNDTFINPATNSIQYFSGSSVNISNSHVSCSSCAVFGMWFTSGNITIQNSTFYAMHPNMGGIRFQGNSNASIYDSSFTVIIEYVYFLNNATVNATTTTFNPIKISTNRTQRLEMDNVSASTAGHLFIGDSKAYLTNTTITSVSITADGPTNITFSSIGVSTSSFSQNSTIFINHTTLTPDANSILYFSGSSVNISNSRFSSSGYCSAVFGMQFTSGNITIRNSTFYACHPNMGGIRFQNTSSASIYDSSFTISNEYVYFLNDATVNATNTTFNPVSFSGASTLYNKNYFTLFVNDSSGRALRNVSVVAYNATSDEKDAVLSTDAFGWLNTSLLWYKQNATQAFNVTLTVNVTAGDSFSGVNQTSYTMTVDRAYNATMVGRYGYLTNYPSVASFAPSVTVYYENESLRPWNGSRQVELRTGTTLVANFSWNFSAGDLNLSNVTVTYDASEHYVGINGTNVTPLVTTVWVPVWGKACNVRKCTGKANYSHCAASDWTQVSSTIDGAYCVVATNGTVVQDRPSAVTTKIVIRVPGWDEPLVAILFGLTLGLFAVRGQRVRRVARG